jgi:threonine dehydratase
MAAGCALALAETSPSTELWIAEPEGYDETWASIRAGKRLRADPSRPTICDAIATPSPGEQTFPILQRAVRGGLTVAEDEVRAAMAFAFRRLKLVVEPGGAVALAALLAGTFDAKGRSVGITLSGGNVDAPVFAEVLKRFG